MHNEFDYEKMSLDYLAKNNTFSLSRSFSTKITKLISFRVIVFKDKFVIRFWLK